MSKKELVMALEFYRSRLEILKTEMCAVVSAGLIGTVDEETTHTLLDRMESEVEGINECIELLGFLWRSEASQR